MSTRGLQSTCIINFYLQRKGEPLFHHENIIAVFPIIEIPRTNITTFDEDGTIQYPSCLEKVMAPSAYIFIVYLG